MESLYEKLMGFHPASLDDIFEGLIKIINHNLTRNSLYALSWNMTYNAVLERDSVSIPFCFAGEINVVTKGYLRDPAYIFENSNVSANTLIHTRTFSPWNTEHNISKTLKLIKEIKNPDSEQNFPDLYHYNLYGIIPQKHFPKLLTYELIRRDSDTPHCMIYETQDFLELKKDLQEKGNTMYEDIHDIFSQYKIKY